MQVLWDREETTPITKMKWTQTTRKTEVWASTMPKDSSARSRRLRIGDKHHRVQSVSIRSSRSSTWVVRISAFPLRKEIEIEMVPVLKLVRRQASEEWQWPSERNSNQTTNSLIKYIGIWVRRLEQRSLASIQEWTQTLAAMGVLYRIPNSDASNIDASSKSRLSMSSRVTIMPSPRL